MKALLLGAVRALHSFLGSSWLVLLVVSAAAAWFYVDACQVRADRDAWASWGDQVCAFAGATTTAGTVEVQTDRGKKKVTKARGQLCSEAVQDLAAFKARSQSATSAVLAGAARAREEKISADVRASAVDAADRHRDQTKMEEADAQVRDDDRVDGNWFAALNDLGGLRRH